MKKWLIYPVIGGIFLLALVACSPTPAPDAGAQQGESSQPAAEDREQPAAVRLSDTYDNALPLAGQLALGSVRLDETELAIDEAQAAELLPMWQALQSLSNSSTTAKVELAAVINQIQDLMTQPQIQAIQTMALTNDSLSEMIESGELAFSGGRFGGAGGGDGFPAGGFPGGGPGGGGPGGGGGFAGGGGNGGLSEDDIATRQAARETGDSSVFQERALMGMAVRLLAEKAGKELNDSRINIAGTIFNVATEVTGLSLEEIQSQMAEGSSLAEIINAKGGEVSLVRDQIITALDDLPNASDLDLEQLVDQWLNGVSGRP